VDPVQARGAGAAELPHPVVITGTLWPDLYIAYAAVPVRGSADPRARERELLDLAAVVRIDPEFSPAEQDLARRCAPRSVVADCPARSRLSTASSAAGGQRHRAPSAGRRGLYCQ
jgi:hypothetical protein